jgi:hypothetical protein
MFYNRTTKEIRLQCLRLAKFSLESLKIGLNEQRRKFKVNIEPNEDLQISYNQFVSEKFEEIFKNAKNQFQDFEKKIIKNT